MCTAATLLSARHLLVHSFAADLRSLESSFRRVSFLYSEAGTGQMWEHLLTTIGLMAFGILIFTLMLNVVSQVTRELFQDLAREVRNWRSRPRIFRGVKLYRVWESFNQLCWSVFRTIVMVALGALGFAGACFMLTLWSVADLITSADRRIMRRQATPMPGPLAVENLPLLQAPARQRFHGAA